MTDDALITPEQFIEMVKPYAEEAGIPVQYFARYASKLIFTSEDADEPIQVTKLKIENAALRDWVKDLNAQVPVYESYRHKQSGELYEMIVSSAESQFSWDWVPPATVYKKDNRFFIRPCEEFLEKFEKVNDGGESADQ